MWDFLFKKFKEMVGHRPQIKSQTAVGLERFQSYYKQLTLFSNGYLYPVLIQHIVATCMGRVVRWHMLILYDLLAPVHLRLH